MFERLNGAQLVQVLPDGALAVWFGGLDLKVINQNGQEKSVWLDVGELDVPDRLHALEAIQRIN